MQVLCADVRGDVLGGGDGPRAAAGTGAVGDGLAAGIDAGAEAGGADGFGPGEQIGGLLGQKTAALLLIEEEKSLRREVLALRGLYGGGGIRAAEGLWRYAGPPALGFALGFDLGVEATVPENEEAEAGLEERGAPAGPGVCGRAGRRVQPVADEAEVPAQGGQRRLAGEGVAVKACEGAGLGGLGVLCVARFAPEEECDAERG